MKSGPADEDVGYDHLHPALAKADYLVLSCPLAALTEGLLGEAAFDTLPNDARVVNVSRGKVVQTVTLVAALQRNLISGAALDVTDPEPCPADHSLWGFDNVVITLHNAGSNPRHWNQVAEFLAKNHERVDETGGTPT